MPELSLSFGGFSLPPRHKMAMELASTILGELQLYNKTPDDILLPVDKVASYLKDFKDMNVYYEGVQQ